MSAPCRGYLPDGQAYAFTEHALRRLLEMEQEPHAIFLTLGSPEEVLESRSRPGAWNYRRGDLTLGVVRERGCLVVTTALYSNQRAWREAELAGRLPADRRYRPEQSLPGARP